jgi:hypothetical protein
VGVRSENPQRVVLMLRDFKLARKRAWFNQQVLGQRGRGSARRAALERRYAGGAGQLELESRLQAVPDRLKPGLQLGRGSRRAAETPTKQRNIRMRVLSSKATRRDPLVEGATLKRLGEEFGGR